MKKTVFPARFTLLLIALLFSGFGCAFLTGQTPQPQPAPSERSGAPRTPAASATPDQKKPPAQSKAKVGDSLLEAAERYRLKARESEKGGDLPRALQAWGIVKGILSEDSEAAAKVARLKKQIPELADRHFQKGLGHFRSRSYGLARKEFLAALFLKPDHPEALQYLKEKMAGEDFLVYPVQKGDTPGSIARKVYEDPQKDFLVAYFNDLKLESQVEPPRELRLPVLNREMAKVARPSPPGAAEASADKALEAQAHLWKMKEAYRQGNYRESGMLAERRLSSDPENREYRQVKNASYYEMGIQLADEKKFEEALAALQRVDPDFKDRDAQIAQNRKHLAEVHYLRGVKFFVEEEIEEAIREWEKTLSLDPAHANAKRDIQNGRTLLQNLKKIQ